MLPALSRRGTGWFNAGGAIPRIFEGLQTLAVLDRYLEALRMPGAQAITFKSGSPVEILANNAVRTVNNAVPTYEQLMVILAEVLPAEFKNQGLTVLKEYPYQSPLGPVKVIVQLAQGACTARVQPWTGDPPPAAEPPRPTMAPGPAPVPGPPSAAPRPGPPVAGPPASGPAVTGGGKAGHMDELFHQMLDAKASDLHLKATKVPYLRIHGEMALMPNRPVLTSDDIWTLLQPIMPQRNKDQVLEIWDTDFAYELPGRARMRCNVFKDIVGFGAVFRQIPTKIQSVQELNVPKAVVKLCDYPKGLVLVTGPTGSGKSTTLAALVDYINDNYTNHIITIEDPVEFVHVDKKSLINQREVGSTTASFKSALRAALREDPDTVLIGELRDLETMAIAIETAETGHLVFGTLHTNTAASTVDRIIDQFPGDRQGQIRSMLAESLLGVVSQTLCRRIGGGRAAAMEVMLVNSAISNLIREGKVFQIPSTMQTARGIGMQTMNDSLLDLVKTRVVEPEEAYAASIAKREMAIALTRAGHRGAWSTDVAA